MDAVSKSSEGTSRLVAQEYAERVADVTDIGPVTQEMLARALDAISASLEELLAAWC